MATDSFKFWDSYYDALRMLGDDERRGRFVMALCSYVFDGEEPDFGGDEVMAFGFQLVATQARQSMEISRAAREAGMRGGRPRNDGSKRGVKSTPKRMAKRGAESEKKREEAKGNEASSLPNESDCAGAGADAPPPLP